MNPTVLLLSLTILGRLCFSLFQPDTAYSIDMLHWPLVVQDFAAGNNPYLTTTYLNYFPLWPGFLWLLAKVGLVSQTEVLTAVKIVLTAVECGLILTLGKISHLLSVPAKSSFRILLWGIALNPICIFLTCQHGQFDVIGAYAGCIALCFLVKAKLGDTPLCWRASGILGVGILAKIFPIFHAPFFAQALQGQSLARKAAHALALTLPPILGAGFLYYFVSEESLRYVIGYRSLQGFFGISGFLQVLRAREVMEFYVQNFKYLVLLLLCVNFFLAQRARSAPQLVFANALAILLPVILGSGYGPQYAYWFLPFLVLSFMIADAPLAKELKFLYAISVATYIFEYCFFTSHGALIAPLEPYSRSPEFQTVIRLPMFLSFVAVACRLWSSCRDLKSI